MICGIDEAGRGCVGGSLFVCGIAYEDELIPSLSHLPIKDSKKLSKSQREQIALFLLSSNQLIYHIAKKEAQEIDAKGLSQCLKEALEEVMESVFQKYNITKFIYDGNSTFKAQPPLFVPLETLIKGDALIHQISSASILAKYAKDQECQEIHTLYPQYGFLNHSGYCTQEHKIKIKELGYTPFHRKSFRI
ncbi:ribonuclease HII [Helicobacter pametensis]|uniref:ribonuclease HII n=1 Tax=Helicobacter pametensis TaxID=95149 RepID=UPI0004884A21|nr:ribonuclease HII [Helicobacter pametensis]